MKQATQENMLFYNQLWGLLEDLHIGVFTVNLKRQITSFNRAAELITGHNEGEVLGRYCHEIFGSETCQNECKFHQAVKAEQRSLNFEMEIMDRNKEKHLINKIVTPLYDSNHEVIGCIEVFQDYSAFEELIDRIRYDERRLKIILDNLDLGVFTVTRGGLITSFNTLAESISGFKREEVIGKPCSVILDGENCEGEGLLKQAIADGAKRSLGKGLLRKKDGQSIPVRANFMALINEKGNTIGGLATIQDLSIIHQLNREISGRYTYADMIGRDPNMQRIFEILPVIADSETTVLVEGPTGTGKDLLAKVIHNTSKRNQKPFVKVNCAALPDNLLESEMFGYAKGAFTGADRDKPGRFQEADGGTIFLDEIGDLPLSLQAKLLRVLEEKEFYPLGSRKITRVDVRIIAATNRGLEELVEGQKFREDLFYRLNVIRLELPPLRERRADIPLLIDHILKKLTAVKETRARRISEDALELLLNYHYPGNIRELENILEHALIICQDETIDTKHMPKFLQKILADVVVPSESGETGAALEGLGERQKILDALNRHQWHRGKTAEQLALDRTTLWRKMKKYNIHP